jgi:hypothetical protein
MVFATRLLLTPKSSSAADGIEEVAKIQMVVGVGGSFPPPLTHWHCELVRRMNRINRYLNLN